MARDVAVITGGTSGLGAATARRLASQGKRVVVIGRNAVRGDALAAELDGLFVAADVTDAAALETAFTRAQELGPVRVAVSCAGAGWAARTLDRSGAPHDLGIFEQLIKTNLIGAFNLLRLGAAAIAKAPVGDDGLRGVVILTSSTAGSDGQIGQLAYAAAKGGITAMTLPAARDLAPVGIRVVTIAPGLFDTPMLGIMPQEMKAGLAAHAVLPKRLGAPEEFARLVEAVIATTYLNGETIRLDAAMRLPPK